MFESYIDVAQEDLKRREFRKRGLDLVKRHGGREIDGENGEAREIEEDSMDGGFDDLEQRSDTVGGQDEETADGMKGVARILGEVRLNERIRMRHVIERLCKPSFA